MRLWRSETGRSAAGGEFKESSSDHSSVSCAVFFAFQFLSDIGEMPHDRYVFEYFIITIIIEVAPRQANRYRVTYV